MFYVLLVYIDIWGYAVGGFVHYEDGFHGKKLVGTGSWPCAVASFDTSGVWQFVLSYRIVSKWEEWYRFWDFRNSAAEDSILLEYEVTSLGNRCPNFRGHCISSTRPGQII